ncbi:sensor histidine kinase [Paenibacillus sp. PL91]|uniref:sensor histidine kinase n=1 Tax=Paenibacillus sp. PL91 TaxID=2729538 RepID=UPI00145DD3C5|nr:HAMP domain-containing sensor histidine kinase [Paenibacillus sp. PL91]MBC9202904.1 HAMP domain-containing histidine kinase [Paenibacillus sp. PL91]
MKKPSQRSSGMKFRQTLLSRYMFIILFAFLFIPIVFPLSSLLYVVIQENTHTSDADYLKYGSGNDLIAMWHTQASLLREGDAAAIDSRLHELKQKYAEASFFWVDSSGSTRLQLPQQEQLPRRWMPADAIQFMKKSIDSDPFTVVSFLGSEHEEPAFMVMQLPRSIIQLDRPIGTGTPFYIAFLFIMLALFFLISLLFFRHIRKRLLGLQAAMALHGDNGLPQPIALNKPDEIGQLEAAFNHMVEQLRESAERERAEEELRKRLIASLSHDLRTPLTVMSSHLYSLQKESISTTGHASIKQMEQKIASISSLIENLLSYTLMTSGRYPLQLERQDLLRIVRESAASWFPLWEQEGIAAEVELPDEQMLQDVDKDAFRRVLDNLFQNVTRHAVSGKYIGIKLEKPQGRTALVIHDHGSGLENDSISKGAGIGLAIVDYLLHEMNLEWHMDSHAAGTSVYIFLR